MTKSSVLQGVFIGFLATASMEITAAAQTLTIQSPQTEVLVNVGDSSPIQVQVDKPELLQGVALTIPGVGTSGLITSSPYNFVASAPSDRCGTFQLFAFGKTTAGTILKSAPIAIRVTCPPNTTLSIQPSALRFNYIGQQANISVLARNADDSFLDVGGGTTFKINDPSVAVVDSLGRVTAVAPGNTTILASYAGSMSSIPVTVIRNVTGDLDDDGDVDSDDLAILQQSLNTQATTSNDSRDLNHDGKIDALDARALTLLCTRPRCAVQ